MRIAASGSTYQSPLPLPLLRDSPRVLPLSRPEFWPAAAEAKLDGKFGPAIVCVCAWTGVDRCRGGSGSGRRGRRTAVIDGAEETRSMREASLDGGDADTGRHDKLRRVREGV